MPPRTTDPFTIDPWCVREPRPRLGSLGEIEAAFTLANGCLGIRGTYDEGDPAHRTGTYLAGLHELRDVVYTETGCGEPEATETLVHTIDGSQVRLSVDGHPLDLRAGELPHHERVLDMRAGTLARSLRWRTPAGRLVEVRSERLVSFVHRGVAAVRYRVRAVDEPVQIALTSSLVANGPQPHLPADPTSDELLEHPLVGQEHHVDGGRITLVHRTRRSGLCVAAAADHRLESPAEIVVHADSDQDWARLTATASLAPGEEITMTKLLGYAWSADRSLTAVRDEVSATLTTARHTGWADLVAGQRAYLDAFWADADVEVEGDDTEGDDTEGDDTDGDDTDGDDTDGDDTDGDAARLQQAVRFALWHLLQATARAEGRGIAGKGLTGTGYEGHAFWDSETFVLRVMTALRPETTRQALGWRHATMDAARARARQIGLHGAAFPWRTISGPECSGYWPAGTAALHVNADIADAVVRYVGATGDEGFARTTGLDLLVETARMWASSGLHGRDGRFHIHGVTGPDEYSALGDDNVYTNLMAQQNLQCAAEWARAYPAEAQRLGVDGVECDGWEAAARAMAVPYDEELGVHPQSAGFTDLPRWEFENTPADGYPLQSHHPYMQLYRKQVVKQADLVLAMQLRGDAFTAEQKERNFAYYEAITVRDSSLSASCQAVLGAEVGHLELALDYVLESGLADLRDAAHDSSDGLHLAALAGTWIALVAGFGGMRQSGSELRFRPALPSRLSRVAFRVRHRGVRLRVDVRSDEVRYALEDGAALTVHHEDEALELTGADEAVRPLKPRRQPPPVEQPLHRGPVRRDDPPED